MSDSGGEPGYCACCREFHLLTRHWVPAMSWHADICRFCEALGDGELAWRLGGITEDGGFGYETVAAVPLTGRRWPGGRRRDPTRLAEALLADQPHGGGFEGFGPSRRTRWQQARIAWRMLRGRA